MTEQANHHLLLIDDDFNLGQLLKEYLEIEGFKLDTAHNGADGIAKAEKDYDLILLDVMMPDMSGFEVLKIIRQKKQILTPVLMLTAKGDEMDRVLGLELGADDYLPKPYSHRELVARVKALIRRSQMDMSPEQKQIHLDVGGIELDTSTHSAKAEGNILELTTTEFKVLQTLMIEANKVVDKNSLNLAALGRRIEAYDRSIDMHVSNLRKKIQAVAPDLQRIKTIRGVGYMFTDEENAAEEQE